MCRYIRFKPSNYQKQLLQYGTSSQGATDLEIVIIAILTKGTIVYDSFKRFQYESFATTALQMSIQNRVLLVNI